MGKSVVYISNEGKEIDKSVFDKNKDCQITIDPRKGKWNLLMVSLPTEAMLKAAGDNLADWLVTRRNMANPYEKGAAIRVIDDKVDEFTVILPDCSIEDKHIAKIGAAWNEWAKKITTPTNSAPDDDKKDDKKDDSKKSDDKKDDSQKKPDDQTKKPDDKQDSKPDDTKPDDKKDSSDQKKPDDKQQSTKKHFWDMTDAERIAYNKERMGFYMKNG